MFKKDQFWFGALLGLVLPLISFYFVEKLKMDIHFQNKNHLSYILSVAVNLVLVRVYYGKGKEQTARGIIAITFISAFAIFMYKLYS